VITNAIDTIQEHLRNLSSSIQSYVSFANEFKARPNAYVIRHFSELIKSLKSHKIKSQNDFQKNDFQKPEIQDLITEWNKYINNPKPSDYEIKRIIRLGLSTLGLEDIEEFRNLIKRQDPQRTLHNWLNNYVWRFQILNPDFKFKDKFWLELLEGWHFWLINSPTKINYLMEKHEVLLDYDEFINHNSHQAYFKRESEAIFKILEEQNSTTNDLLYSITEIVSERFYVNFYNEDAIIDELLNKYFDYLFQNYLDNRNFSDELKKILFNCCNLFTTLGCERFIKLFKAIEKDLSSSEEEIIKNFTKNKLGDPRVSKSNWQILKDTDEKTFKKILCWFTKHEFNLFFEFVFAGSPDPHKRKECWQRYLDYADDFRIFLPTENKIKEFKKFILNKNSETIQEPILNKSGVTSFVIKIDEIFIIETKETGNASYVYDVGYINQKHKSELKHGEKTVKYFFDEIFREDGDYIKKIPSKEYTRYEGLAPDGKNEVSFLNSKHWRFTHDQHCQWHQAVTIMMKQVHKLDPVNPKNKKYDYL
jgi:hypothetical protein